MSAETDIAQALVALAVPVVTDAIRAWSQGKADPADPVHAEVMRIMGTDPLGELRDLLVDLRARVEAVEGVIVP
jgi:hypothetical protein